MRLKEIGLHAQNMNYKNIGLNSQHKWQDLCDHSMNTRIFTLIMNKIVIWAPNIMRKEQLPQFGFANDRVFHIPEEVG